MTDIQIVHVGDLAESAGLQAVDSLLHGRWRCVICIQRRFVDLTNREVPMRTYQQTVTARIGDGFNIHVEFADGTKGIFDFSPYMEYPCYAPLRDRTVFEKVAAEHGTLSWPGEIDIAPEAVWAEAVRV